MHFVLFNIPVLIHPTFWIFLIFFSDILYHPSIETLIIASVMFFSLLVHEFGHALTAVYFGKRPTITLEGFGGNASYKSGGITAKQQFLITLNGPLLESMLILISYGLLKSGIFASHYYIIYTLYITMYLNIYWCLINLIPVDPLDGGKLLRYFLVKKFGDRGYKISTIIGISSALIAAPLLYLWGSTFFPILLLFLAFQNYQNLSHYTVRHQESPYKKLLRGIEAAQVGDKEEAKKIFTKLIKIEDKQIKHSAIEELAKIYHSENGSQQAYKLLLNADHARLNEGKNLLCKLAFEHSNHELIARYSHDIYALNPTFETAVLNSQAYACLNNPELAAGWLDTASKFGTEYSEKIKEVFGSSFYDEVRDHEACAWVTST